MRQEKVNRRHPPEKKTSPSKQKSEAVKDETKHVDLALVAAETVASEEYNDTCHLDIGQLVDECFGDEKEYSDDMKENKVFPENTSQIEEIPDHHPERMRRSPAFDLTFEEDFRIHELMVRKENLFEGFYNVFLEFPNFVSLWKRFLLQIKNGCPVIQSGIPADSYDCKMKKVVRDNFVQGLNITICFFHSIFSNPVCFRRSCATCAGNVR